MQASDHYLTTKICILIVLCNLTDSFSFALGNTLFRMSCDVTQVKKRWECSIGEITFLAKLAYLTILLVQYTLDRYRSICSAIKITADDYFVTSK